MTEQIKSYAIYFLTGGIVTTIIVWAEQMDNRLLSGFATLIPVFTLVSYLFIGSTRGGMAVSQHAWLVLFGTLASWVPYMIIVAVLAPRLGAAKAIAVGLAVFFVCAFGYLQAVWRFQWFK